MIGTFDETQKELTEDIKQILLKTCLSFNETNLTKSQSLTSTFSSYLARIDSIDNDGFYDWLRLTLDKIRLLSSKKKLHKT